MPFIFPSSRFIGTRTFSAFGNLSRRKFLTSSSLISVGILPTYKVGPSPTELLQAEFPPLSSLSEFSFPTCSSLGGDFWPSLGGDFWSVNRTLAGFLTELLRISLFNSFTMIIIYKQSFDIQSPHIRISIKYILVGVFYELSLNMLQRMEKFLLNTVEVGPAIFEKPESFLYSLVS